MMWEPIYQKKIFTQKYAPSWYAPSRGFENWIFQVPAWVRVSVGPGFTAVNEVYAAVPEAPERQPSVGFMSDATGSCCICMQMQQADLAIPRMLKNTCEYDNLVQDPHLPCTSAS